MQRRTHTLKADDSPADHPVQHRSTSVVMAIAIARESLDINTLGQCVLVAREDLGGTISACSMVAARAASLTAAMGSVLDSVPAKSPSD